MKYFLTIVFTLLINSVFAQNDCSQALIVCGDSNYTDLSASGVGIQELTNSNTCGSQENNSIWLELNIHTGGTLGFTLRPTSNDITIDYDFFVFGPHATCGNIGQAIRCSTTNPQAAGSSNNHTGMNSMSGDTSEGPGADGNNFVKWLTVQAGEKYFLVIDRPIGNSNFSLQWTGTAQFNPAPTFNNPTNVPLDLHVCDVNGNGRNDFNLNTHAAMLTNSQPNMALTFHRTLNDATTGELPLATTYTSTMRNQRIYTRITNTTTGCYDVTDFRLISDPSPTFTNPQNISLDINSCDTDGTDDGVSDFDLLQHAPMLIGNQQNVILTAHLTQADADTGSNPIPNPNTYRNISNPQTLYYRTVNTLAGCFSTKSFTIQVRSIPVFTPLTITTDLIECDTDGVADQKFGFDLTTHEAAFIGSQTGVNMTYYETAADALTGTNAIVTPSAYTNTTTPQTIYMRMDNGSCYVSDSFIITVTTLPVFLNPTGADLKIEECDADSVDDKSTVFNLTKHAAMFTGTQANMQISYYIDATDAASGSNSIISPAAYRNAANPQTVYVRMENTVTGCTTVTSFDIEVVNLLTAGEPEDLYLCDTNNSGIQIFNLSQNDLLLKNGNHATTVKYYLSETDAQNQVNALPVQFSNPVPYTTQTIWARLQNVGGCIGHDIKSFTINIYRIPNIDFEVKVTDFTFNDNSITILIDNVQDYEFSLDDTAFTDDPVFTNLESGIYKVYVRSKTLCKTVDKEVVILNYPRFFTPNADGYNDYWRIPYLQFYPGAEMTIFDRYGKLLHVLKGNSTGWNGTYNGTPLPSDDYWFVLKFNNGRIIKGHFAMLR